MLCLCLWYCLEVPMYNGMSLWMVAAHAYHIHYVFTLIWHLLVSPLHAWEGMYMVSTFLQSEQWTAGVLQLSICWQHGRSALWEAIIACSRPAVSHAVHMWPVVAYPCHIDCPHHCKILSSWSHLHQCRLNLLLASDVIKSTYDAVHLHQYCPSLNMC